MMMMIELMSEYEMTLCNVVYYSIKTGIQFLRGEYISIIIIDYNVSSLYRHRQTQKIMDKSTIEKIEQKLMHILEESRTSLESADKITFGNHHVQTMKQCNHDTVKHVAEALALLRKV